jgi:hypothetical protein
MRLSFGYKIERYRCHRACEEQPGGDLCNAVSTKLDGSRMPRRPRSKREFERVRRTAAAARAQGQSAMGVALARIGAAFDEAAASNAFKLRVERLVGLGPHHAAARARFGARAAMLVGYDLDMAIAVVERQWRNERKAFQLASALGCGNRLSLEVLREFRLLLRLMRYKGMAAELGFFLAALCDKPMAMAAE